MSSDDDMPVTKGTINRAHAADSATKSSSKISKTVDRAMDKHNPTPKNAASGISIRNGPMENLDIDKPTTNGVMANGAGKRRSRPSEGKSYKEDSSEADDKPLSKKRKVAKVQAAGSDSDDAPLVAKSKPAKPPKVIETSMMDSGDSDVPLTSKLAKKKEVIEKRAEKEAMKIQKQEEIAAKKGKGKRADSVDEDDVPLAKKAKTKTETNGTPAAKKKGSKVKKEDTDQDDIPLSKKAPVAKKKAEVKSASAKKPSKLKQEETAQDLEAEEEEEEYRWWEDPSKGDGTKKWDTLQHQGVVFPPPYEPLPKNVKMLYDGQPVTLAPDAEEVAGFFGSMLHSTHNVENPTFQKNFFDDFTKKIKETGGAKGRDGERINIKEFAKCNFRPIYEYYDAQREAKKALPGAEKKRIKAEKDEAEAPYMYCMWNGRKQKVGNFRVEPPGLFRGRGEHPKTGRVKTRVQPEQITINIGKEATVPPPPEGHRWKEIKHDNEGTWLAMWQENINGAYKYVMLAANSDIKGQSDFNKFEKARELKKHIAKIRKDYEKEMKSEVMADRQRATAVYLIDKFALRAGNEKGEDEADTVGCCSLKFEHVTLEPPNKVIFDFLGKDSIRFYDEVVVDPQVFKNLKIFKKAPKGEGDEIFDRLTTSTLNKHLSNYMPGLTAKVFRTYNASFTMSNLLQEMKVHGSIPEKVKEYNDANREVAVLCNHKRTVAAAHGQQMEKLGDKIKGIKYQKWRVKQMMIDVDPKIKKRKAKEGDERYFELDDDLTHEWIREHQKYLVDELRTKIQKKFDKENEKRAADGEKEMKPKELEERLEAADDLAAKYHKENRSGKVEAEGKGPSIEKLEASLEKLDHRLKTMMFQAEDKENNKEVALGTSKINYIDPRLTVVFSKKFNVPIERFFSKTLREKFDWAIKSVDENWTF